MNRFPSMQAREALLAVLERQPLGYEVCPLRQSGSHSAEHPPLTFAFHDDATIPTGLVRKILVEDVGLDEAYHHESDGWWAESPDVEGWSATGDTYAEVAKLG